MNLWGFSFCMNTPGPAARRGDSFLLSAFKGKQSSVFHQSTQDCHLKSFNWSHKLICHKRNHIKLLSLQLLSSSMEISSSIFKTNSLWLLVWTSVCKAWMKKPLHSPPLPPLQLARSQADLHFRASGPRADQVAQFTAAKTLRALFLPPSSSLHPNLDCSLSVIFPVTLTSSEAAAAKKLTLSNKGKWTDCNLNRLSFHWMSVV